MPRDPYARFFRFQYQQHVHWACDPTQVYTIAQRRLTDRCILGEVIEYRLARARDNGWVEEWAYEPDLEPWEGPEPP